MDEFEKWLEKQLAIYGASDEDYTGGKCDAYENALEQYLAFKAKAESPAINGLEVTVCPTCGTPIKRCEGCPPMPVKAKADGGLVEKLEVLQKGIYALKLKERDGLANPETELNDRYRLGISAGLGIASDKMLEILRKHKGAK